jgi:hypothetical protein
VGVQENEFTGCVDKVQGMAPGGKKKLNNLII